MRPPGSRVPLRSARQTTVPILAVLLVTGCYMGVNPISVGPGPEERETRAADAVLAHGRFLQAINAENAAAIERALGQIAVLWTPENMYVGRAEVVSELNEILGTGPDRIRLAHTGTESCLDRSVMTAAIDRPGADPGETAHLSIDWARDDASGWQVSVIRFVDPHPDLAAIHDACGWVRDREAFVTRDRHISLTIDPQFLLRGQRDSELAPWDDGVRIDARVGHRVFGRFWIELFASRETSVDDESAMNDELRREENLVGAVASYEIGLARIAVGTAYSAASWAWYRPAVGRDRLDWSRSAVGAIVEASISQPLRQGFSLDARLSGRTFGHTVVEPIADRPLQETGGPYLGVDVGVGYRF